MIARDGGPAFPVEPSTGLVRSCSWCGEHTSLDRVTHMLCDECTAVMEEGADRDANDRDLVLIAVKAFKRATYECAVQPTLARYERRDRANTRIIRLLDKAIESSRPRPSDERRTLVQGEEGAGDTSGEVATPREGSVRPSARTTRNPLHLAG